MSRTHQQNPSYLEDQRGFFDQLVTQDWATYLQPTWDHVRRWEVQEVFRRTRPRRILDVGCGCGFHDVLMANHPGVDEVVGIDYSARSIVAANREYPHPRVRREAADLYALGSRFGRFDLAISFQVIEHVPDPAAFLDACRRLVRPGGWVAALTPNRRRVGNRLRRVLGLQPGVEDPQHFCEFTVAELTALGEALGLQYHDELTYGFTVTLPRLGWSLVPEDLSFRLGQRLPPLADRFGIFFRVSG